MTSVDRCAACGALRPLADLLRVVDRDGLERPRLVCRPMVLPSCFRTVRPGERWSIELAAPPEAATPQPLTDPIPALAREEHEIAEAQRRADQRARDAARTARVWR